MKVSVIIPTYNRLVYLKKCIRALKQQTINKKNYEIIIVDDGSRDGTENYIREIQKKEKQLKIKYYKQKNKGQATARNKGVGHAKGEYLAFTDDDCKPRKDWMQNIIKNFKITKADAIRGHCIQVYNKKIFQYVDDINTKISKKDPKIISHRELHPSVKLSAENFAVKKNIFIKLGGFNERFKAGDAGEDVDLAYRIIKNGGSIKRVASIVVEHHQRGTLLKLLKRSYAFGISDARLYKKYFKKKLFIELIPLKVSIFSNFPTTFRIQNNTFKMLILSLLLLLISPLIGITLMAAILFIKSIGLKNPLAAIASMYTDGILQSANFLGNIIGSVRYKLLYT